MSEGLNHVRDNLCALPKLALYICVLLIVLYFRFDVHAQDALAEDILTAEEREWVQEHPVLRATNDRNWAPIDFVRNGEAAGFSIDYLNLVASKVGIRIEYFDEVAWSNQLTKLRDRELDITHSITLLPERTEYLDFTKPYLHLPTVFFGRQGMPRINSKEDLSGYRVGVIDKWGLMDDFISDYPGVNLVILDDEAQALLALSSNTIDVFVGAIAVMNYAMYNSLIDGVEVIGFVDSNSKSAGNDIHLAARNDWPLLATILQKGMDQVTEVEFAALARKWQTTISSDVPILELTEEENRWLIENNRTITTAVDTSAYPL